MPLKRRRIKQPPDRSAATKRRDSQIIARYQKGEGLVEIGERFGYTAEGIRGVLIRRGVPRRTPEDRFRANKSRDDRIVAMYKRDFTCKAIGEKVGLTWAAVHAILVKRGIPRKPPGWYPAPTPRRSIEARELVKKVAHLYDTGPGTSAIDLARMTGLNHHTVRRYLVALGVTVRIGAGLETKVNTEQVRRIKAELARGKTTFQALADRFGISKNIITGIAMERAWAHVPWPKGRTYVRRPHGSPKKLTAAKVRLVKADLQKGLSFSEVASRYAVTSSSIFAIATEKVWAHVPWPGGRGYVRRGQPWKIKLTPEKVREIKAHLCKSEFTLFEIGEKYGVSEAAINHIAAGNTWKSVPWPNKRGYIGREPGQRPISRRKGGMVLETAGRRREERRKGERAWEESRGRAGRE